MGRRRGKSPLSAQKCKFCHFTSLSKEDLNQHVDNCKFQTTTCNSCDFDDPSEEFASQQEEECNALLNDYCMAEMKTTNNHNKICRTKNQKFENCFMSDLGCTYRSDSTTMQTHEKDYKLHFPLMIQSIQRQEEQNKKLDEKLSKFKERVDKLNDFFIFQARNLGIEEEIDPPEAICALPSNIRDDRTESPTFQPSTSSNQKWELERCLNTLDCIKEEFETIKEKLEHIKFIANDDFGRPETKLINNFNKNGVEFEWIIDKFSSKKTKTCQEGPLYDTGCKDLGFRPGLFLNSGKGCLDVGLWINQTYTDLESIDFPKSLRVILPHPQSALSKTSSATLHDGFTILDDTSGFFYIENFISYEELDDKDYVENDTLKLIFKIA